MTSPRRWTAATAAVVVAAVALLAPGRASAQSRDRRAPRTIVAAAIEDWAPEYYVTPGEEPTGFAIDLARAVAERAGLDVQFRAYPNYTLAFAALEAGEIDLIPIAGVTPERSRTFAFTVPVETFGVSVFVRRDTPAIRGTEDLAGRSVAVVESNVSVALMRDRPASELAVYPDVRSALFDLLAGHVDALVHPEPVIWKMAQDIRVDDRIRTAGPPIAEVKRAMTVRRDDAALHRVLDRAAHDLVGTAEYQALYVRWFGQPEPFWTVARVAWAAGIAIVAIVVIVAVWRSRARAALDHSVRAQRQAEVKYEALMARASDGLFAFDERGRFVEVNPRACAMTGYTRDEILGLGGDDLIIGAEPSTVAEELARLDRGEDLLFERKLRRKDGSVVPVEIHASRVHDGLYLSMVREVEARQRVENVLREKEEQLQRAQKMQAIGRLAGGVAHDFNNLLTGILGYVGVLRKELPVGSRALADVAEIEAAAKRGAALTRQLLAIGRRSSSNPELLRPAEVVADLENILRRLVGRDVTLEIIHDVPKDASPTARIDRVQLEQVVLNLVLNARDASEPGGCVRVRVGASDVSAERAAKHSGATPGAHVLLEVRDWGSGMDEATRAHIFEPLFTTKGPDEGTGLGLSTVQGIVERHGGLIEVETRPGEGSTFRALFPVVLGEVGAAASPNSKASAA